MLEKTPNLLFVCVENSNRSQMAEGFARTLRVGRVLAFSAGSRPWGQINPRAIDFMREVVIDLTGSCRIPCTFSAPSSGPCEIESRVWCRTCS